MIELRTTERATFKQCPTKWNWGVKEGLAKRRTATPLWFGTAVHIALAEWYQLGLKRGVHPAATFAKVLEEDRSVRIPSDNEEDIAEYVSGKQLGISMLEYYVETYKQDSNWDVIAVEQTGHIYLPKLGEVRGRGVKYYFTFDGVYRDLETGLIWLMEHKTAASINTEKLALDEQASSYWAVAEQKLKRAGLIKESDRIEGIMFNFLRKKEKDVRPTAPNGMYTNKPLRGHYVEALTKPLEDIWTRKQLESMKVDELHRLAKSINVKVVGEISKSQPPPYFLRHPVFRSPAQRKRQLVRIQQDVWHIDRARNDPSYPILKTPSRDCGWCDFFQMCQLDEEGDREAVEDFKEVMYIKRDPYAAYRKSAE